jgi:hypothetical protein
MNDRVQTAQRPESGAKTSDKKRQQLVLEKIWPRTKRKHLFPEIPMPLIREESEFSEGEMGENEGVGLEMKEKQMFLNSAFLSRLKDRIPEEQVIEAVLDHGITHYTFCPWDFHTHAQLYAQAKKVTGDRTLAKRVSNYFIDVVADTYCVKKRNTDIPELRRSLTKGRVDQVIASLYQKIWGIDLGVPVSFKQREHEQVVRRLARIPYLDRSRWIESIQKFARSIKPLLMEDEKEQGSQGERGQSNPMGDHDFDHYSLEEIDQGLRDYAKETMKLSEFREVIEDFSEDLKEAGYGMEGGMGRGMGTPLDADVLFYMKLAEQYSLPVQKTQTDQKGTLHPHSHSPWEVGSPIQDVDVWTSFGKIMPGVTQVWKKQEGRGKRKIESVPDCLIAIDSSGSMINPRKNLSYAVLGAACAADAYLRNHSRVAVYNFSDAPMGGKDILSYTHRREDIYRALCKYFGGGTALDLDDLMPMIEGRRNLDLFIITDMKITNLETLTGFFEKIQNRITTVHIGENPYASRFEKAVGGKKNISIFTVKKKEDIPHIVLGKIGEYFSAAL